MDWLLTEQDPFPETLSWWLLSWDRGSYADGDRKLTPSLNNSREARARYDGADDLFAVVCEILPGNAAIPACRCWSDSYSQRRRETLDGCCQITRVQSMLAHVWLPPAVCWRLQKSIAVSLAPFPRGAGLWNIARTFGLVPVTLSVHLSAITTSESAEIRALRGN